MRLSTGPSCFLFSSRSTNSPSKFDGFLLVRILVGELASVVSVEGPSTEGAIKLASKFSSGFSNSPQTLTFFWVYSFFNMLFSGFGKEYFPVGSTQRPIRTSPPFGSVIAKENGWSNDKGFYHLLLTRKHRWPRILLHPFRSNLSSRSGRSN